MEGTPKEYEIDPLKVLEDATDNSKIDDLKVLKDATDNYKIDSLVELNKQRKIIRENDPHYKTPLAFAKWRVDELKKPRSAGTINNIIDAMVSIFLGVLGQHRTDVSYPFPTLGKYELFRTGTFGYYKALIPLIIYIILFAYDAHAYRILVAMVVLILTFVNSNFYLFFSILVLILASEIYQLFAPKDA